MTRILHTGDTHLGYQQYHRPTRREDFQAAFTQVAEDAVADDVAAVIHAGDLFHDRTPTLSDIMGAMSVLRILDDADVPFLAIVGNHESKRNQQWLDLFESMGLATRLGSEPVSVGNTAFYGLDFVPRSQRESYDYEFASHDAEYAAVVTHGLFEPFEHGDWDARTVLAESPVSFDAMLLGDDHTPQTRHIEEPTETWLTYCGSTERASASERDERGYNLVTFEDGVDIRRRGIDTRDFVFVDVELNDTEGSSVVRERIEQYDIDDAVVIVTITGEGEEVMPAGIEEFAEERGSLVTRVNDQREISEEADVDVTFADPDEAVRERIQELGLSPVAREVDETVRASKVADSNVADAIERRVSEVVEEADDGAFDDARAREKSGDETPSESGTDDEKSQETMEDYL
ncbi:DNA double-strand break repair protein Mre11 [Halovenus rubra]|uniref:DNA double-strand break repair protein Mre11 n=2 Tax=Halovenus rubra TaxID=869890 RepID=A0ABD5X2A0_9EURY|nr:DNA double-strand break repair protein Mre11 [Halovenus rubra]